MTEKTEKLNPLLSKDLQIKMRELRALVSDITEGDKKRILAKIEKQNQSLEEKEQLIQPVKEALEKAIELLPNGDNVTIGEMGGKFVVVKKSSDRIRLVDTENEDNNMSGYDPNLETSDIFEVIVSGRENLTPKKIYVFDADQIRKTYGRYWSKADSIFDLDPRNSQSTEGANTREVDSLAENAPLTQMLIDWVKEQDDSDQL